MRDVNDELFNELFIYWIRLIFSYFNQALTVFSCPFPNNASRRHKIATINTLKTSFVTWKAFFECFAWVFACNVDGGLFVFLDHPAFDSANWARHHDVDCFLFRGDSSFCIADSGGNVLLLLLSSHHFLGSWHIGWVFWIFWKISKIKIKHVKWRSMTNSTKNSHSKNSKITLKTNPPVPETSFYAISIFQPIFSPHTHIHHKLIHPDTSNLSSSWKSSSTAVSSCLPWFA